MNTSYRFGVYLFGDASALAKAAKDGEQALKRLGSTSLAEYQRTGARGIAEARRMASARETLGIRSEREVQREIHRTEAAYNRLARSGTLSWREQARAARSMREEVTRLKNEMGQLTTRQKLGYAARGVGAVAAGAGITAAVVAPRVQRAMDYDTRLSRLANTAFSDRDDKGWEEGKSGIARAIKDAMKYGGGSRDETISAAENLHAAGGLTPAQIASLLRETTRAATATGGAADDFANIAIKSKTMDVPVERSSRLFDIAAYGGKQGQFEVANLARWLPDQMGYAKKVGLYGEEGFAKLVAMNQAAILTAGSKDEAGNNVKNLLLKIGSGDTNKDFAKLGINLPKEIAEGRMRGVDAFDVVAAQLEKLLKKDRNYQDAQRQLALSKNDTERAAKLRAVSDIAQGVIVGKGFQDAQALSVLTAFLNNRGMVSQIAKDGVANAGGVIGTDYRRMSGTAGFKTQQAKNAWEVAQQESLDRLTPAIGRVADKVTELVGKYPGYTVAIGGATLALTSLSASAGVAALLLARGAGKGTGLTLPGPSGAPTPSGAGKMGFLGKLGWVGAAATTAASLFYTSDDELKVLREAERKRRDNHRGKDFADPRILGASPRSPAVAAAGARSLSDRLAVQPAHDVTGVRSLADRLGNVGAEAAAASRKDQVELLVRVQADPGTAAQALVAKNPARIPFRTDPGRSNTAAGF